jgi:hypothetical protein
MSMQMWMVVQRGGVQDPASSRELQHFVRERGGFVLMVTRTGPLVALDDAVAAEVEQHPLVEFMGPVALNPRGIAADRLERIFAANLSRQLDPEAVARLQASESEATS